MQTISEFLAIVCGVLLVVGLLALILSYAYFRLVVLQRAKKVCLSGPMFYRTEGGDGCVLVRACDYHEAEQKHRYGEDLYKPIRLVVAPAFLFYSNKYHRSHNMSVGSVEEMGQMIDRVLARVLGVSELYTRLETFCGRTLVHELEGHGVRVLQSTSHLFVPFIKFPEALQLEKQMELFGYRPLTVAELEEFLVSGRYPELVPVKRRAGLSD